MAIKLFLATVIASYTNPYNKKCRRSSHDERVYAVDLAEAKTKAMVRVYQIFPTEFYFDHAVSSVAVISAQTPEAEPPARVRREKLIAADFYHIQIWWTTGRFDSCNIPPDIDEIVEATWHSSEHYGDIFRRERKRFAKFVVALKLGKDGEVWGGAYVDDVYLP